MNKINYIKLGRARNNFRTPHYRRIIGMIHITDIIFSINSYFSAISMPGKLLEYLVLSVFESRSYYPTFANIYCPQLIISPLIAEFIFSPLIIYRLVEHIY